MTQSRIRAPTSFDNTADAIDVDQGAAFYIPGLDVSVQTNVSLWPSSTRSELAAIFIALLACPCARTVKIFTDSAAAIMSLSSSIDSCRSRRWTKINNSLLITKILSIVKEKQLHVTYIKVRGHSGDTHNDEVDRLARDAKNHHRSHLDNTFKSNSSHITYFPVFENKYPIEQRIRRFIQSLFNIYNTAEWALLRSVNDHLRNRDIAWDASWMLLKQLRGFNCNSRVKGTLWTFAAKAFMNILPLVSKLRLRKPHLYSELYCPSCSDHTVESITHFFQCETYKNLWSELYANLRQNVLISLEKNFAKYIPTRDIKDRLLLGIFRSSATSDTFTLLARAGLELKYLQQGVAHIKMTLDCPQTVARRIATIVLWNFIKEFKYRIWAKRCELMIQWETSRGIRQRDKLSDNRKSKKRHRRSIPDNIDSTDDPYLATIDDYHAADTRLPVFDTNTFVNFNDGALNHDDRNPLTRRERQGMALPAVWCQMRDYILKNARHPWIYSATRCFMPDSLIL